MFFYFLQLLWVLMWSTFMGLILQVYHCFSFYICICSFHLLASYAVDMYIHYIQMYV